MSAITNKKEDYSTNILESSKQELTSYFPNTKFFDKSFLNKINLIKNCIKNEEFRDSIANSGDVQLQTLLDNLQTKIFKIIKKHEDNLLLAAPITPTQKKLIQKAKSVAAELLMLYQICNYHKEFFENVISEIHANCHSRPPFEVATNTRNLNFVSKEFNQKNTSELNKLINNEKIPLVELGFSDFKEAVDFAIINQLTHVDFRSVEKKSFETIYRDDIDRLLSDNKNINFLAIQHCDHFFGNINLHFPDMPNLETLILKGLDPILLEMRLNPNDEVICDGNRKTTFHLNLENLTKLKHLELTHIQTEVHAVDLGEFKNLEHLHLEGSLGNFIRLNHSLDGLKKIKRLRLAYTYFSSGESKLDFSSLKNLEYLELQDLKYLECGKLKNFEEITFFGENLRYLLLQECDGVQLDTTSFPKLESLILALQNSVIDTLSCENLKMLALVDSPLPIVEYLTNLKHLALNYTSAVRLPDLNSNQKLETLVLIDETDPPHDLAELELPLLRKVFSDKDEDSTEWLPPNCTYQYVDGEDDFLQKKVGWQSPFELNPGEQWDEKYLAELKEKAV